MANRTDTDARSIHGTNPQNLVEKITRNKIYASVYWKKDCFGLSAETLVDKAVELKYVGGMIGEPQKPTEFICLILKMLQIQPDKEIIIEFIKNDDYKYVRLLGAYYLRLVGRAYDVYTYLEPLYNDFRRVRVAQADGTFALGHVDEVVDDMLRKDYLFDVALPHIPMRHLLEKAGTLEPRISLLDEDEVEQAIAQAEQEAAAAAEEAAAAQEQLQAAAAGAAATAAGERRERPKERRERSPERERDRSREKGRERSRERGERRRSDGDKQDRQDRQDRREVGGSREDYDSSRGREREDGRRDRDREERDRYESRRERDRHESRREREPERDERSRRGGREYDGDYDRDYDRKGREYERSRGYDEQRRSRHGRSRSSSRSRSRSRERRSRR